MRLSPHTAQALIRRREAPGCGCKLQPVTFALFALHRHLDRAFCARLPVNFCREVITFQASRASDSIIEWCAGANPMRDCTPSSASPPHRCGCACCGYRFPLVRPRSLPPICSMPRSSPPVQGSVPPPLGGRGIVQGAEAGAARGAVPHRRVSGGLRPLPHAHLGQHCPGPDSTHGRSRQTPTTASISIRSTFVPRWPSCARTSSNSKTLRIRKLAST